MITMNSYIQDWLNIIENMSNDNTYKLAWGRAIIESACLIDDVEDNNIITFKTIAHKMIKYYWNQTFFFNLKQSANTNKPPVLVQQVQLLINKYIELSSSTIPVWFDKAECILETDNAFYNHVINTCARKLKDDVSWRFMIINKQTLPLYQLNKDNLTIELSKNIALYYLNYLTINGHNY